MTKNKLSVWYDEEGDFLEITLKKSKDSYFNESKKDVAEIIDKKTNKIVGYAIFNFKKQKSINLDFTIPKEMAA